MASDPLVIQLDSKSGAIGWQDCPVSDHRPRADPNVVWLDQRAIRIAHLRGVGQPIADQIEADEDEGRLSLFSVNVVNSCLLFVV